MTRTAQRLVVVFAMLFPALVYSQISLRTAKDQFIEQRIENIVENLDNENLDFQDLFETLLYYADYPLNLNEANRELLLSLPQLNEAKADAILKHIERFGPMVSLYELRAVPGLTPDVIEQLLPFITVEGVVKQTFSIADALKNGRQEVALRYQRNVELARGYKSPEEGGTENGYLGSPYRVFARYRYRYGTKLSIGATAEKDAGEEFFGGTQPQGFDFYSAHLFYRGDGLVRQVAVGDFQAQFGQGLTFWSGLAIGGKSAYAIDTDQEALLLRPFSSVNENLFLRGVGVTLAHKNWSLTPFYSRKRVDGNIAEPTAQDSTFESDVALAVSSLQESGFHRTANEVADKDAVWNYHYGAHLRYGTDRFQVGLTSAVTGVDGVLNPRNVPYNLYRQRGNEFSANGLDYRLRISNFDFFGEVTRDMNGTVAGISGVRANLNPRLAFSVLYRNYPKEFVPLDAVAFSESLPPTNEKGLYIGANTFLFKKLNVQVFYDQFSFPWLRFRVSAPTRGADFFAQAAYRYNRRLEWQFRYRHREKPIDITELNGEPLAIRYPGRQFKRNYRTTLLYRLNYNLQLRTRVEWSQYYREDRGNESGFLLYQDLIWTPEESNFKLTLRYAIFDTESYDARIYAYENDVLYNYSIPAYNGRGIRWYALFQYSLSRSVDLWARVAQTSFADRTTVGSGLEQVEGNARTELKLQMRVTF